MKLTLTGRLSKLILSLTCLLTSTVSAQSESPAQKTAQAAIAIPDPYAAAIAKEILMQGGNAVDAAVATGFALAVTYIDAGNIGGGGFMLTHIEGESAFLDYRERAPFAAHRDMYLDEQREVIENATLIGGRATAVPGTVAGMWTAHQRYGSLLWRDLIQPAIKLARQGFLPAQILVDEIHANLDWFGDKTNFKEYFSQISADQLFKQPELAMTLERIADAGPADFYQGETARLIVKQMDKDHGLISMEDLESYEAVWRAPLEARWRNFKVLSAPPPSSGGFGVIQLLKMKDALTPYFEGVEHNSHQYVHLIAEMEKQVFADRGEYLGDSDFVDIDIKTLISDGYIDRRAKEVNPKTISSLEGVSPGLTSPNTTHYSIIDQWGNAVSNTYTINWAFGSGVVVEGAGFLLNNEMDDFSVKPGSPNVYGVVGTYANEIQPGKRPLSSMSPTILLEGDEVMMAVGTPGGSTIFTSVFQTITNIIDFDMTPLEAVSATRFHHQLLPPELITMSIANPLPAETIYALEERGYNVQPHDWEFGDVQVIWREGGALQPAADPRDRGVGEVFAAATNK
tara:strand:- start:1763 stop:3472 length:1710 start_codon:yes stop_codon:yes gene_type:complete